MTQGAYTTPGEGPDSMPPVVSLGEGTVVEEPCVLGKAPRGAECGSGLMDKPYGKRVE